MKKNPLITVLMPTYNGAKYLRETIDSILNQTFTDFEFLIINDCSPDGSETDKIINSYNDNRIRYIKNDKNLGISGSSNKGIELSKGKYIARQDHDDISMLTRFEKQINIMENNPNIGICGTWAINFDDKGKEKKKTYPVKSNDVKAEMFNRCAILHPASMIRRSLLLDNNLKYNEEYKTGNDLLLWLDSLKLTDFYNVPEYLFKYRKHENRTSKKLKNSANEEAKKLFEYKFNKIGYDLPIENENIFYNMIVKNRSKKITVENLQEIEKILIEILDANNKSQFFPLEEFNNEIGLLWHRRCLTYMLKNKKSIKLIYKKSDLSKFDKRFNKMLFNVLMYILP